MRRLLRLALLLRCVTSYVAPPPSGPPRGRSPLAPARAQRQLVPSPQRASGTVVQRRKRASVDAARPGNPRGLERALKAARSGDGAEALDGVRQAVAAVAGGGAPPLRARDCNMVLSALGRARLYDKAEAAYELMAREGRLCPTVVTFSTLIAHCAAQSPAKVQKALFWFGELRKRAIAPDEITFNTLLNVYAKAGQCEDAQRLFERMASWHVTPTVVTYNSLMDAYARATHVDGSFERAAAVFARLRDAGLHPTTNSYSILISAAARRGDVAAAFALRDRMVSERLLPNAVTWSSLVDACAKAGELEKAFATFDEMVRARIAPNVVTYTILVDACGKAGRVELAVRVFRQMLRDGLVAPNRVTCNSLMDTALKAEPPLLSLALELFDHMALTGLEPSAQTCTSLLTHITAEQPVADAADAADGARVLTAAQRAHTAERVIATFRRMRAPESPQSSLPPWLQSELVALFASSRRLDAALDLLDEMVRDPSADGAPLTARSRELQSLLPSLLDAVDTSRRLDRAIEIFDVVREMRGVATPRSSLGGEAAVTYEALLGACARAKRLARAADVLQQMSADERGDGGDVGGGAPSRAIAAAAAGEAAPGEAGGSKKLQALERASVELIGLCNRERDSRTAVRVFDQALASGVRPSIETYTDMLEVIARPASAVDEPPRAPQQRRANAAADVALPPEQRKRVRRDARRDSLFRAFLMFQEMQSGGIEPDVGAYNALIHVCAKCGDASRAFEVFRRMQLEHDLVPDVITYTSLIKACAVATAEAATSHGGATPDVGAGRVWTETAERVFEDMQQRDNHFTSYVAPNAHTFEALMEACLAAGRAERALELLDEMLDLHGGFGVMKPVPRVATPAGDWASLRQQGAQPLNRRQHDDARELARARARAGVFGSGAAPSAARPPEPVFGKLYRHALVACETLNRHPLAMALYASMRAAGLRADNRAALALVRLCERAQDFESAARVRRERSEGS